MIFTALIFFLITAVLGLVNLAAILKNKRAPLVVLFAHGVFAGIALLVLATYIIVQKSSFLLLTSLILFVLAALGGFSLLIFAAYKKPAPKAVILIHPLVALTGLILLL